MGFNGYGELGDGTSGNQKNIPEKIVASGVTAVAAGSFHSLFIKSGGSLWAMGRNFEGQLGDGTSNNQIIPEQIVSNGVIAVASQGIHSLFLKSDGSLWGMGDNSYGELGDGTFNSTNKPELIISNNVIAIAGGYGHSMFLKADGSLWVMGSGSFGGTNTPQQIVSSGVTAIAGGGHHSLFIKSDGSLWAVGGEENGQFGDTMTTNFVSAPEQIVPLIPIITSISLAGTNLTINGIHGLSGNTNNVLMSTNVAQPLNQWRSIATNVLSTSGNFTITATNAVISNAQKQFYILQSQ